MHEDLRTYYGTFISLQYYSSLQAIAAVKRLLCIGKDILKPKCYELSNNHFEMLAFLEGNELLLLQRLSYQL